MRLVIQVVTEASVTVEKKIIGKIGRGFLVLAGVEDSDTEELADRMLKKMLGLRIFPDENGKTNLSLADVGGEVLLVSQFTLYADCRKGNRPSFVRAGKPDAAEALYEYMIRKCRETVPVVEHGQFGADMKVALVNDGPFTIVLDSKELFPNG
ncbi:MAG: D-aminoacyl-tRNA deacylase [Lachnospiraceae bacterium]|nr:D-aminoacyl-tRNA deacylase [Lachnospiraceae bacterium]